MHRDMRGHDLALGVHPTRADGVNGFGVGNAIAHHIATLVGVGADELAVTDSYVLGDNHSRTSLIGLDLAGVGRPVGRCDPLVIECSGDAELAVGGGATEGISILQFWYGNTGCEIANSQ